MSDLFTQLAGGLAVVDAWPSLKPREDYYLELTPEEYGSSAGSVKGVMLR